MRLAALLLLGCNKPHIFPPKGRAASLKEVHESRVQHSATAAGACGREELVYVTSLNERGLIDKWQEEKHVSLHTLKTITKQTY